MEWIGLVLVAALSLGALAAVVPVGGGRTLGEAVLHALACAVRGGCATARGRDRALVAAYGARDAALVRRLAPNVAYEPGTLTLPVDWRHCRSHSCSDAPDRAGRDVARSMRGGVPATAFTHVVHRGGETFVQYWFYYPDSTTTWGGAAAAWHRVVDAVTAGRSYPGFHLDDWESYMVRVDAAGRTRVRASAHHGYQYCKGVGPGCADAWGPPTGWTRVSRGSHAGHIPGARAVPTDSPDYLDLARRDPREGAELHDRTTRGAELQLVPLESIDPHSYRALQSDGPTPPWAKDVYRDPASDSTG